MTRLGILGGSFDPVHEGHLHVARCARDGFALHRVLLSPASQPPHKWDITLANPLHRLAMVRLAVEDDATLDVLTAEVDRGGTSFTIDTVRALRQELSEDVRLFFIIGSDTLGEIPTWIEYRQLVRMVTFITIERHHGESATAIASLAGEIEQEALDQIARHILTVKPHPASSTEVRRRLAAGESLGDLVPARVAAYIEQHGLYR